MTKSMCVVLVYFLTSCMSILDILCWSIYWWLCKQNITW